MQTPIGKNKFAYGVAVLAGDQVKINDFKKSVRESSTTANLIEQANFGALFYKSLEPALRLRFGVLDEDKMLMVTIGDFTKKVNSLKKETKGSSTKENQQAWHFNAVVALAKDNTEAVALRKKIADAVSGEEFDNITFIDATDTPLNEDDFNTYLDYSAMANYYQGNNGSMARDNKQKADAILSVNWKNRIFDGLFRIWNKDNKGGKTVNGFSKMQEVLKDIVLKKFKYVLDFRTGLTETQFKLTNARSAAICGINQKTEGIIKGAEKSTLSAVWNVDNYWKQPGTSDLEISRVKNAVEDLIEQSLSHEKQVALSQIFNLLTNEYGYSPSNFTVFLIGFLLKEYSLSKYRYVDKNGVNGEMTPDKLADMISGYAKNLIDTLIVQMSDEERSFYKITSEVWGIPAPQLSSPAKAAIMVKDKMQDMGLPIWCIKEVADDGLYELVSDYINIVQKEEAKDVQQIATEIGAEALQNNDLSPKLKELLTRDNLSKGMLAYVKKFEGGKLTNLVAQINATESQLLSDISELFSVDYSSMWNMETGNDQLRKLIVNYEYVKTTNHILDTKAYSREDADQKWREKLDFVMCSSEILKEEYPNLENVFNFLKQIALNNVILPDNMKLFVEELNNNADALRNYFSDEISVFKRAYGAYLDGLNDNDVEKLRSSNLKGIFKRTRTESNAIVKKVADEFRKGQVKTKLFNLWITRTKTKSPRQWSELHRTPVLALVPKNEYDSAEKAFDALNKELVTEDQCEESLRFLTSAKFFEKLNDEDSINMAFRSLLGDYRKILTDIDKVRDALETTNVPAYDWASHPTIKLKIEELASAEYDAGVSDMLVEQIQSMGVDELKDKLISLVQKNVKLGVQILDGDE